MDAAGQAFVSLKQTLQGIAPLPDEELDYLRRHAESRTYAAGREYNKAFARPGEIVMPLSAVVTRTPSAFAIEAVTDAQTLAFPTPLVPELYRRHPAWERIGRVLAEQMAIRKEARERELLLDSAFVRFQRFAERYPELIEWIPQRQIASYIGVTEQALSRLLRTWRERRLTQG